jgi:hypothetical protein
MKKFMKGALLMGAVMAGTASYAQIQDEENVTVTMELVPILQLNMNTPDQVNFVFDEIPEYIGGITQYGATILTVSSTVNWDLFATGTSAAHQAAATEQVWDFVVGYGPATPVLTGAGARSALPLTLLELHQFPTGASNTLNDGATPTQTAYYGGVFSAAVAALPAAWPNNIYVSTGSAYIAPPAIDDPYIAGGFGVGNFVNGGSYLTQGATQPVGTSNYYFVIDYRIVPGLPAIFPKAGTTVGTDEAHNLETAAPGAYATGVAGAVGAYAKPGVYTMNAKYLLVENQ